MRVMWWQYNNFLINLREKMKTHFLCMSIIFLIQLFCIKDIEAQNPPCAPNFPYVTYNAAHISSYPPYSLSMPFDVLISYVALDTISRYGNYGETIQFIKRQTFNDTLKKIMHYYYQMVDYDPIRFYQTTLYRIPNDSVMLTLDYLKENIYKQVRKQSPYSNLDYMLIRTDYILHIKALSINVVTDTTTSGPAHEVREVSFQVLDTIKGKVIPFKIENSQNINIKKSDNKNLNLPYNGIIKVFQYSPNWGNLRDANNNPWIKTDSEYVVFLVNEGLCDDLNTGGYFNLRPVWPQSSTFGMYPVINGLINGADRDFNFIPNQSIEAFKASLRTRINEICSY